MLPEIFGVFIRESIFAHFEEVISKKETSGRMLDSLDHFKEVEKYFLCSDFVSLNVNGSDCDEKVESWNEFSRMLYRFIEIHHFSASPVFFSEILFERAKFIEYLHK